MHPFLLEKSIRRRKKRESDPSSRQRQSQVSGEASGASQPALVTCQHYCCFKAPSPVTLFNSYKVQQPWSSLGLRLNLYGSWLFYIPVILSTVRSFLSKVTEPSWRKGKDLPEKFSLITKKVTQVFCKLKCVIIAQSSRDTVHESSNTQSHILCT